MKKIINEQLPISPSAPLKARYYDYEHFTYPWHFHSEWEIIYIREGEGTWFAGNTIEAYSEGDIILFGSNLPHCMKSGEAYFAELGLRVKGTIIQFEKDFMYHSINHYPQFVRIKKLLEESKQCVHFPAKGAKVLGQLMERIPQEQGMEQFVSFLELLHEMTKAESRTVITSSYVPNELAVYSSRIDKILSYLNMNYTRPVDLDEITSLAAMNRTAFCRFFKRNTGKTLKQYILDMRIAYACKLLLMEGMNISQISVECGFETISHFNKTFKKTTGYPPTLYREIILKE
ncbi:AraC family transcriptional regulator [Bacteroidales bacterium OttesenSCG-928-L03]|nr:AraC family transcriptional regulator [Bacteroidales bacterium OttesenSCG-928-L03]